MSEVQLCDHVMLGIPSVTAQCSRIYGHHGEHEALLLGPCRDLGVDYPIKFAQARIVWSTVEGPKRG